VQEQECFGANIAEVFGARLIQVKQRGFSCETKVEGQNATPAP
jgi:hypothetical protein